MTKFKFDNWYNIDFDAPTILLSHADMDGASSVYFASILFTNIVGKYCSGYPKVINGVEKYTSKANQIVLVDLAVPDDALKLALKNFDTVILADHHPKTGDYISISEKIPNKFKLLAESEICATKILAKKCIQEGYELTEGEIELAKVVDVYDVWRENSLHWNFAYDLNTIFWFAPFSNKFTDYLKNLETMSLRDAIPAEMWIKAKEEHQKVIEYVTNPKNREIYKEDGFTVALYIFPKRAFYINDVLLQCDDINIAIGFEEDSTRGSMRSNLEWLDLNEVYEKLKEKYPDNITHGGGHNKACGITLVDGCLDNILDIVDETIEIVDNLQIGIEE